MKSLVLAASLGLLPLCAGAQSLSCSEFFEKSGIAPPPEGLRDDVAAAIVAREFLPVSFDPSLLLETADIPVQRGDLDTGTDCTIQQLAALTANLQARQKAVPPEQESALYGTWVSDNILTDVIGLTVAGREVLVIAPPDGPREAPAFGPPPSDVEIRQYWYRALEPFGQTNWTEDGDYVRLVVEGNLPRHSEGGYYAPQAAAPLSYRLVTLDPERTEDLFIKSRLNHFDRPVHFALEGDTLVLDARALVPVYRVDDIRQLTYHRVADGSPDMSLRLIGALGLPMSRYFDCLTRKISDEAPELLDVLAPLSLQETDDLLREYHRAEWRRNELTQRLQADRENQGLREELIALMKGQQSLKDRLAPLTVDLPAAGLCGELSLR